MTSFGYFYQPFWADQKWLYLRKWTKSVVPSLRRNNVRCVIIDRWEDPTHSIDRLTECGDQITQLWIHDPQILDLSPVSCLYNLEQLVVSDNDSRQPGFDNKIEKIDFSQLTRLRRCVFADLSSLGNLPSCTWLEELVLIHCALHELTALTPLTALKLLHLSQLRLTSLFGLECLSALRTLVLDRVSLTTLDDATLLTEHFGQIDLQQLHVCSRTQVRFDRDEIEERKRREQDAKDGVPRYQRRLGPDHPACLMFLVDQSGSMGDQFGASPKSTKAKDVAEVLNHFLQNLTLRCFEDGHVKNYWHVGMIGYSDHVGPAFGGTLAGRDIVPISEITHAPLRFEKRKVQLDDVDGPSSWKTLAPVWIDPRAGGDTRMRRAFVSARERLERWVAAHPSSFPPIVINLTDTECTDGVFGGEMAALKRLATDDGEVLLFHLTLIPKASDEDIIAFPNEWNEWGAELHRLSNSLPTCMHAAAQEAGYNITAESRGFLQGVAVKDMLRVLDIFTALPGFETARERVPWDVPVDTADANPPQKPRRASNSRSSLVGAPLSKEQFWKLVDKSRRGIQDRDQQVDNLVTLLADLEEPQILEFAHHFDEYMLEAYRWDLWGVAYLIQDGCSDDGFEYFICWLISQGRAYFEKALATPESAGRRARHGESIEFEEIWTAAPQAHAEKTGKIDFDDRYEERFPRVHRDEPKGVPWTDDEELKNLYPNLARKFWQ